MDDEIMVLASERPVIQTALNVPAGSINELQPGQAILMSKTGKMRLAQINRAKEKKACSFERIYFSRGSDMDIYKERKLLGEKLVNPILKAVDYDVEHTVFSFIPNTAEVAFYGLLEGFDNYLNELKVKKIEALGHHPNHEELEKSCPGVSVARKWPSRISSCVPLSPKATAGMTWPPMCTILLTVV